MDKRHEDQPACSGDPAERRAELRITRGYPVFVELPEAAPDSDGAPGGPLLLCRLVDFSANGACIRLDRPLPEGAILRISASVTERRETLSVIGEIRWVVQEEHSYLVGFRLYEADQTDIIQWKRLVASEL